MSHSSVSDSASQNRAGALKNAHRACASTREKHTSTQLDDVMRRELLVAAQVGRPLKQAPRMFVTVLRSLETGDRSPKHYRTSVFARGGSWSSRRGLSGSARVGLSPAEVKMVEGTSTANLTQ